VLLSFALAVPPDSVSLPVNAAQNVVLGGVTQGLADWAANVYVPVTGTEQSELENDQVTVIESPGVKFAKQN
jgi:hypothetical protein